MNIIEQATEEIIELARIRERMTKILQPGNGEFHLRTIMAMAQWAVSQQPFQKDDMVFLDKRRVRAIKESSGWYRYRETMAEDGPFRVTNIGYNLPHTHWYADVSIQGRVFAIPMTWLISETDELDRQE